MYEWMWVCSGGNRGGEHGPLVGHSGPAVRRYITQMAAGQSAAIEKHTVNMHSMCHIDCTGT